MKDEDSRRAPFHSSTFILVFGPVAQRNESATLRRSRSHVQIVPGPPIEKDEVGRMKDGESHSSLPAAFSLHPSSFILAFAGVAQQAGGASLRN
jgi:hypothetical protein